MMLALASSKQNIKRSNVRNTRGESARDFEEMLRRAAWPAVHAALDARGCVGDPRKGGKSAPAKLAVQLTSGLSLDLPASLLAQAMTLACRLNFRRTESQILTF